jgi:hypothetical protein
MASQQSLPLPNLSPIFPLTSNGTASTRSITSKPQTHASLTHCHPEQVTASLSKRFFETTLHPNMFDRDVINLQDVINEQLDLFDGHAATTAVNNLQRLMMTYLTL